MPADAGIQSLAHEDHGLDPRVRGGDGNGRKPLAVPGFPWFSAAVAILLPMLALGVPVIDTLLVMVLRFLEQPHSRLAQRLGGVFSADRNHLHHLIEAWRGSHATVVRVIYALVGLSCGGALLVAMSKSGMAAVTIAVVELAVIVVIRRAGLAARARATMAEKRTQVRQQIQAQSGEVPALRQP